MSINILPFRVYQVLSEYTDADHALPMGELLRLLRTEYGLRCDRRAVYAALDKLRTVGCHIPEYQDDSEGYRLLSRPLEPSEVRLLSDAVSAFPGISRRQCERLLKKLGRGLSRWQREQCRPLSIGIPWRGINQETFLSVEVLEDQPIAPLPPGLDLERYVRERVYPFPGEAVRAVLRCEADLVSDVLDRFGMETQFQNNGDGTFDAMVFTGAAGLKFWALQYVAVCQLLEPDWLRREIGEILRNGWERYQNISSPLKREKEKS